MKKLLFTLISVPFFLSLIDCSHVVTKENYKPSVWKTITLGTYKSMHEYEVALWSHGYKIPKNSGTQEVFKKVFPSLMETHVDLVLVTTRELGFTECCPPLDVIYARAEQLGLTLCWPEVGPALRLEYSDQPKDENLLIAMRPIDNELFYITFFTDETLYGRWLYIFPASMLDKVWLRNMKFVLVLLRPLK